jgi:maltose O-acetyltransferase
VRTLRGLQELRATQDSTSLLSLVLRQTRAELVFMRNHLWRTTLAGSPFVPSVARWAMYRVSGLRVATPNVREQCVMHNSHVSIGKGTFLSRAAFFEGSGQVSLGEQCQVGPECTFLTSHHDVRKGDDRLKIALPHSRDVTIGDRVWVGARVTFLPGCSVDSDTVVAAGAVVSGHLESGWVYGGVPARRIAAVPAE